MQNPIKRLLKYIVDLDLVTKTQFILLYATLFEIVIYMMELKYLNHDLVNVRFFEQTSWLVPTWIGVNIVLILIGQALKVSPKWHALYTRISLLYYFICLLTLHMFVGLLNVANGAIFLGTAIVSLIIYPSHLVKPLLFIYGLSYVALAYLTVAGYIDYALLFEPNALIHPQVEGMYVTLSVAYTFVCILITLYIFNICLKVWREKITEEDVHEYTDSLTQLLNQTGFEKVTSLQLKQAILTKSPLSLILLDLDNFSRVNEE